MLQIAILPPFSYYHVLMIVYVHIIYITEHSTCAGILIPNFVMGHNFQ